MMQDEVVTKRKWISEQHFLDLIGATNLIPGPNSTEMAIHIGRERAGWKGKCAHRGASSGEPRATSEPSRSKLTVCVDCLIADAGGIVDGVDVVVAAWRAGILGGGDG